MGQYIARRSLWILLVIVLLTLFAFLVFFVMPPGDPAIAFAGRNPTAAQIAEVREAFGLDRSVPMQYVLFVKRLVSGDKDGWPGFGRSFKSGNPIRPALVDRAVVTFQLAIGAAVIWLLIGIPIGILSALRPRSIADRTAMGIALFFISAPVFWLGLLCLYIFSYRLHWAPGTAYIPIGENPFEWFAHMLMPWFVLAVLFAGVYARIVRGNMLEVMGEDYIRTARAKGLPERDVVVKHGLRASLTPVVTLFGLDFGGLLGGAVVTERVFNLPGLGSYLIEGALGGDLPVVMGVVVFAGLGVTLMNLLVDILYAYLDPRVRYA
ncbi:MAG: ABC transporter permease [Actinomycetota bacterium]